MKRNMLLFLCFIPILVISQSMYVDSLENVLETQKLTPSEQIKILRKICNKTVYYDFKKTFMYAGKGLSLAEKEKDKAEIANFYKMLGWCYDSFGENDSAMIYYDKALALARELKDEKMEAWFLADVGNIQCAQANYNEGLETLRKALSIYEKLGDKWSCGEMYAQIGSVYRVMRNYDHAIAYLNKGKIIAEEVNNLSTIQDIHYNLGSINRHQKKYDIALEHALIAEKLSRGMIDLQTKLLALQLLSTIYLDGFSEYVKALEYTTEALRISEELGEKRIICSQWQKLSRVYLMQKRYKDSEAAALHAWGLDSLHLEVSRQVADVLAVVYIHLGNKEKALHFHEVSVDMQLEFFNDNLSKSISEMEVKYETEKKEMRIGTLEKEKKAYMGFGIAVVVASLFGITILFYRHRLTVQKKKLAEQQILQLEQEKELIATRSALKAEKNEREIIARDLHDGVGSMLSVVKNNMDIMKSYSIIENAEVDYFSRALDVLEKSMVELRRVAHHIMPATLIDNGLVIALEDFCRSTPNVEFHFTEPVHRFDAEKELVLYRCSYELVNNALRHAKASHIDVHLNMDERTVYLSVVDDGCGFDPETASIGMGINNMRTRISVFGGRIDIYSEPEKGTEVNIELDL